MTTTARANPPVTEESGPQKIRRTWVKQLVVTNFRRFERIDLDSHLTVLVAPNGGGKTALLDALSVALRYFVDTMRGSSASPGFQKTDIRLSRTREGQMVPQVPLTLKALGWIDEWETEWDRELGSSGGRTTYAHAGALADRARGLLKKMRGYANRRSESAPDLPVIAYYGTGRLWNATRLSNARKKGASSFDRQIHAYTDCLSPSSSYSEFVMWFEAVVREAQNEKTSGRPSPHRPGLLLEAVRRSTNTVLSSCGWSNLDWDFIAGDIVAEHTTEGRLPVSLLSDGIRNMIALVADLAHRAVRLNPHLGADASRRTPGIVLIDEVDMHLHPEWQQTVIAQLREAFEEVQFVVTTHSPQVLSTVDASSIRVIRVVDGAVSLETPTFQTKGVDVLAAIMGVDPVPQVEEAKALSEYRSLIEDGAGETSKALALRKTLVEHFSPDHPVILDCDRLLRFQAFKRSRPPAER